MIFDVVAAHDAAGSVSAYTLIVNWYAIHRLWAVDLPAFLAWWMPLNVVVGTALIAGAGWDRHARGEHPGGALPLRVHLPLVSLALLPFLAGFLLIRLLIRLTRN